MTDTAVPNSTDALAVVMLQTDSLVENDWNPNQMEDDALRLELVEDAIPAVEFGDVETLGVEV